MIKIQKASVLQKAVCGILVLGLICFAGCGGKGKEPEETHSLGSEDQVSSAEQAEANETGEWGAGGKRREDQFSHR